MKELTQQKGILVEEIVDLMKKALEEGRTEEVDKIIIEGLATIEMDKGDNVSEFINKVIEASNCFNPGCQFCAHKCTDWDKFTIESMNKQDSKDAKLQLLSYSGKIAKYMLNSDKANETLISFLYKILNIVSSNLDKDAVYEYVEESKEIMQKYEIAE